MDKEKARGEEGRMFTACAMRRDGLSSTRAAIETEINSPTKWMKHSSRMHARSRRNFFEKPLQSANPGFLKLNGPTPTPAEGNREHHRAAA